MLWDKNWWIFSNWIWRKKQESIKYSEIKQVPFWTEMIWDRVKRHEDDRMKRLQKYIVIFGTAILCAGFSACSKQPDFNVNPMSNLLLMQSIIESTQIMRIWWKSQKRMWRNRWKKSSMKASVSNLHLPITSQKRRL